MEIIQLRLQQANQTAARRKEIADSAQTKLNEMMESMRANEDRHSSRIQTLESQLSESQREALASKQLRDEIEFLKDRVSKQEVQLVEAAEGGAAPVREQLAQQTQELNDMRTVRPLHLCIKVLFLF